MDQYLPGEGEQAVMVLRFLASSGCEESVMKLIEEKPFIKYFIPPQAPTMSRSDYVKHLASVRPFLSLSFPDLLSDYAKSKWIVSKLIQEMNPGGSPLRPSDSLVTQLKQLDGVIRNCHQTPLPKVIKVDVSINTEKFPSNDVSSVEIQTEISAIHGDDDDNEGELPAERVPLMFYNSLISDTSIPQKLATAINQHTKGDELELPPQFESEIDKFMLDLLNGEDNLSVDDIQQQPHTMLDEGLTNLFGDVDSVITADQLQNGSAKDKEPPSAVPPPQIPTTVPLIPRQAPMKRIIPKPAPTGTPKPHPVFQFNEDAPQNVTEKRVVPRPRFGQHQHPPYTVVTTLPTKPASAWESLGRKSIEPKVPPSSQPETALFIDTKTKSPEKSTPLIIHSEGLESKLKPKLKSSKKSQKSANNNNSINKRKAKCPPVKLTPEKAKQNDGPNFFCRPKLRSTPIAAAAAQPSSSVMITSTPLPQQQKSATPSLPKYIPITESVSPAVMPSNSGNKSSSSKCKESDKQRLTPHQYHTPAAAAVEDKPAENNLIRLTNLSEVTPILDAFESAQKRISSDNKQLGDTTTNNNNGRRLRGMVASAEKFKATTTQANLYRKSFSTPRKKYVRNLLFDTPPPPQSLKEDDEQQVQVKRVPGLTLDISPPSFSVDKRMINGTQTCQSNQAPTSSDRKRKATNESPGEQQSITNKKRRHWTEEEDSTSYKSSAFPDRHFSSIKKIKENMSQMANKIVNSPTTIRPIQTKAKILCTSSGALPPIPEELIYITPPTPAAEVKVVTTLSSSPLLEEGEIADDDSVIVVDEEEDEPSPLLKKQSLPPPPQLSKSLKHSPTAIIKIPERRSKTEKVNKPNKVNKNRKSSSSQQKKKENSSSSSKTREQLSKELFGTDVDETPVKLRKEEKVTEETPVKKKMKTASPVKDVVKVKNVQKEEANVLPFQIEPGPIAFPDPTPVKMNKSMTTMGLMDYNQDSSNSNSFLFSQSHPSTTTLITPMKTLPNQNISPPSAPPFLNLPPTPRYTFHDPETMDSKSNSNSNFTMFRSSGDLLHTPLSTPFKLGPPPTPGRTIFLDEKSQSGGAIFSITMMNHPPHIVQHSSSGGDLSVVEVGKPLDLSSPIPPHRTNQQQQPSPSKSINNNNSQRGIAAVPSHVCISRKTPTVIVGIPMSSTTTLISSSSSSMPPPPPTSEINYKRSKAHVTGQDLKKILPKPTLPPQLAVPPISIPSKPANIPHVNPSKPPINHMTSFQIDGKPVFLAMTEERTLLTKEQTNLKSSTQIKESSIKPLPTTRFTGALKHFNLTRFLQRHSHPS